MPARSHAFSASDAQGASDTPDDAAVFARRMAAHRSIRRSQDRLLDPLFVDRVLTQALAGSAAPMFEKRRVPALTCNGPGCDCWPRLLRSRAEPGVDPLYTGSSPSGGSGTPAA